MPFPGRSYHGGASSSTTFHHPQTPSSRTARASMSVSGSCMAVRSCAGIASGESTGSNLRSLVQWNLGHSPLVPFCSRRRRAILDRTCNQEIIRTLLAKRGVGILFWIGIAFWWFPIAENEDVSFNASCLHRYCHVFGLEGVGLLFYLLFGIVLILVGVFVTSLLLRVLR